MTESRNQITDFDPVENADIADDDLLYLRDRSDTTDGAEGTDKQGSLQDLRNNTDQRVDTPADLRGIVGNDRSIASLIDGGSGGFFRYDESSTATDDGETVIKPDAIASADPGRWLAYFPRVGSQSEHDSPSGVSKLATLERLEAARGRGGSQIPTNADRIAQTATDLRALDPTNFDSGTTVNLLGNSIKGDGEGGFLYWDESSTATDNGYSVFKPDSLASGDPGRWVLALGVEKTTRTLNGDFDAGMQVILTRDRAGRINISSDGEISHSNVEAPSTTSGLIPSRFRPADFANNVYAFTPGRVCRVAISSDGTLTLDYLDWTGTRQSNTDSNGTFSISYTVTP